ncbi:hypothetical protein [Mucilaginibacter ginkgonis]|uniref:Uncharacterized protein n=1 Tax=Mucilaginibacter ginkgonis TaxID=2682091 RepID=A0A6I4I4X4_9SPHI|nr:hypothetical protein [Mucilaginibacter ginkgonis]QQL48298.1 hypothetical protein GO620_008820 [Mucilaginibacter ginkgonis]
MDNVLLILLSTTYDREAVIKALEINGKIDTWFYSFPNTIFVKTSMNPKEMSRFIEEKFGENINFVTQIESDYFGRMSSAQWKNFKKVKNFIP